MANQSKVWMSIILCFIILFCASCSDSYINNSEETSNINIKDDAFDISTDELIEILNNEIKEEDLGLIPISYETIEYDNMTVQQIAINDKLMIWFINYLNEGQGINRVGLSFIEKEIQYSPPIEEGEEEENGVVTYEASQRTINNVIKYYQAICKVIEPDFNAESFIDAEMGLTTNFEHNNYVFHTSNIGGFNNDKDMGTTLVTYEVISSKDVFNKYEDEIDDADGVDFE